MFVIICSLQSKNDGNDFHRREVHLSSEEMHEGQQRMHFACALPVKHNVCFRHLNSPETSLFIACCHPTPASCMDFLLLFVFPYTFLWSVFLCSCNKQLQKVDGSAAEVGFGIVSAGFGYLWAKEDHGRCVHTGLDFDSTPFEKLPEFDLISLTSARIVNV